MEANNWTAEEKSPTWIRLFKKGVLVGSVVHKNDCGGNGWLFFPNYQATKSRRYWGDPISAIKGRLPSEAVDVLAKRFAQMATPADPAAQ